MARICEICGLEEQLVQAEEQDQTDFHPLYVCQECIADRQWGE